MIVEINSPIFSKNIRFLRKKYCLSQTALARLISVSTGHIGWIEHETNPAFFTPYNLYRLSEVMNVSMEDIMDVDLEAAEEIRFLRKKK